MQTLSLTTVVFRGCAIVLSGIALCLFVADASGVQANIAIEDDGTAPTPLEESIPPVGSKSGSKQHFSHAPSQWFLSFSETLLPSRPEIPLTPPIVRETPVIVSEEPPVIIEAAPPLPPPSSQDPLVEPIPLPPSSVTRPFSPPASVEVVSLPPAPITSSSTPVDRVAVPEILVTPVFTFISSVLDSLQSFFFTLFTKVF